MTTPSPTEPTYQIGLHCLLYDIVSNDISDNIICLECRPELLGPALIKLAARYLYINTGELSLLQCLRAFRGTPRRPQKIAHESHNDVRRLCWHAGAIFVLLTELGLRKPPSGNPEGLGLLGEGCTFPLPLWSSNRRESG